MKTVIWVMVYLAICILVFSGWLVCFAQHAPLSGHEHELTVMYLLNLFYDYVLMEPFYQFFQVTDYFKAILVLEDDSGQSITFYKETPVIWIYSLSAILTSVAYLIYAKWFTLKKQPL
ncbi:hypothetical protein [Klebsiella sp. S69]|uniref:hypothetical protein n=1 Tax=Klebsiella sp. S69 TaxID=2767439 RepID=UPI00190867F3|nr:hypothetical protein [Klebsiella sp. S69]MBK0167429.1 hypothetical protein [Klebsiella sp. S69]